MPKLPMNLANLLLQNPNVIGSGYIEHPPQRPFADRVLVQPPTIKPEEIPDWYDSHGVLHHGPRPAGAGGRGQQGHPQRGGGYSTVRRKIHSITQTLFFYSCLFLTK
jgi:hypothetical protein